MKKDRKIGIILIILGISIMFASFVYGVRSRYKHYEKNDSELKYYHTKSELVDEVQDYINYVSNNNSNLSSYKLIDLCEEYNVDIIFTLAQGEIESHFGIKGMASKTNFVWNVGANDGYSLNKINNKYKHNHPNNSIKPYLELLTNNYLVDKTEFDLMDKFVDINGKRWASDKFYEIKLSDKYEFIKSTTKIDSLNQKLNYYAIRCNR